MSRAFVSANELSELLGTEELVLIDTRDPAVYAEAHIPGAVDLREVFTYLATSTPEGVKALREKFATAFGNAGLSGREIAVIYEQSMSTGFGQSCRGYVLLRALGYPLIRVLHSRYACLDQQPGSKHRSSKTNRRRHYQFVRKNAISISKE